MLVVMKTEATSSDVDAVVKKIETLGMKAHPMPGPTRTAIGITGNTGAIDPSRLSGLSGVKELIRVTKPYKLASREMKKDDTQVQVADVSIGETSFAVIAGPCSVENESMIMQTAEFLASRGIRLMRAGAYKPRTSPYSFQGLEEDGLKILSAAREQTGVGIVSEIMSAEHADVMEEHVDMLQIGTRNMQNFSLLKRVGQCTRPVLLKRGMSSKLGEWLMAAEYLLSGGNKNVVLCERGIRTFVDHTRNTLDLSVVPSVKEESHLPILIDPSHATGRRSFVKPMAMAALASGADGVIVEIHPDPDNAVSDGDQSLNFDQFDDLLDGLKMLSDAMGRELA